MYNGYSVVFVEWRPICVAGCRGCRHEYSRLSWPHASDLPMLLTYFTPICCGNLPLEDGVAPFPSSIQFTHNFKSQMPTCT